MQRLSLGIRILLQIIGVRVLRVIRTAAHRDYRYYAEMRIHVLLRTGSRMYTGDTYICTQDYASQSDLGVIFSHWALRYTSLGLFVQLSLLEITRLSPLCGLARGARVYATCGGNTDTSAVLARYRHTQILWRHGITDTSHCTGIMITDNTD